MKQIFLFALALISTLSLTSVGLAQGHQPSLREEQRQLFSLAGSNTIGDTLAPAWVKAFLLSKGARLVRVESLPTPNEYRVGATIQGEEVYVDIRAHGSSTGFAGLEDDSADIAMSSRAIKAEERSALAHLGDLASFESEHVVALDGLAIIVHPSNPIHALSLERLADVFSGKISNWKELGGRDEPISVYARDEKSGTWDSFQSMILKDGHKLMPKAYRFESSDLLSDSVASDVGAIGFVGLASVKASKALAIIDGGSEALAPQTLNVATEDYPLARRLYLYAPAGHINAIATEFIRFTQSLEGQEIAAEVGYVTQNPLQESFASLSGPAHYLEVAKHAQRLSINFRFHANSAQLDNKARRDALRLARYLTHPTNQELRVQLIGFSDKEKSSGMAEVLSKLRATAVKAALFEHGVITEAVAGFGDTRPIAQTQSQAKLKNDRVEVWVYPESKVAVFEQLRQQAAHVPADTRRVAME